MSNASFQPTIVEIVSKKIKYKPGCDCKRELDNLVLDLVTQDMQPLSVVDNKVFRALVHSLDPKYEIGSRKHMTSHLLPAKYHDEKVKLIDELRSVDSIAVTTDC